MNALAPSSLIITVRAALRGVDAAGEAEIVENAGILIQHGRIADIGDATAVIAANPGVQVDAQRGSIAMPGLINAHHHSGITPLQLGVPFFPLELWLPRFMGMRAVDPRLDTLYSAVEMLESGTTTVQHIQGGASGPTETWQGPADAIIAAYGEIGMRVSYSFMIRDQNQLVFDSDEDFLATLPTELAAYFRPRLKASLPPVSQLMEFFATLKQRWQDRAPDTVRLQLAPANLHWCSDAALEEIFATARSYGVKLHMHLDETALQARYARERTGRSAVAHLADLGCLGPDLTIGHGIWADDADLDLLAQHRCCMCHNPSSGLRLASGIAPVNTARLHGVRVALGIDQCGVNDDRDMLQEMRVAWMLHREPGLFQNRPRAVDIFRMATEYGAATTGFDTHIGRLDVGLHADIVLLDWASIAEPYMDARTPLVDALLNRAKTRSVDKVYVGGKLVVTGGRAFQVDRDGLMREIHDRLSLPRSTHEAEALRMTDALVPHIEQYYRNRGHRAQASSYIFNRTAL